MMPKRGQTIHAKIASFYYARYPTRQVPSNAGGKAKAKAKNKKTKQLHNIYNKDNSFYYDMSP